MRTLVYLDGPAVPDALKEWASGEEGTVEWRNGQYFSRPERRVDCVVTDMNAVRDAYEAKGVDVVPVPSAGDTDPENGDRRYVAEDAGRWKKILDTETGEYLDGESKRTMEAAEERADELNAQE